MKHTILVLAFAAVLLVMGQTALAQSSQPFASQPFGAQSMETVSPQGGGDMQQMPSSGLRSYLPMLMLIAIYLFVRRTLKRMGDDEGPFGSGRDFDRQRPEDDPEHLKDAYDNARKTWESLAGQPADRDDAASEQNTRTKVIDLRPAEPAGKDDTAQPGPEPVPDASGAHDDDDFLMGARLVFERLVEAMDGLDVETASQFAGPAVLNEIKHRINEGHPPAASEVIKLDCSVMERKVENGTATVVVYYDAVKKVSGLGPIQMRQLWTFSKDDNDPAAMWMLESMEPVEA